VKPRERAEALARSWWDVSHPLCVWHATYNRRTCVSSSRTEAEAWSKVADVTAPLADDIERAILAALAEQAAGEAERTAQAEMARDVAWVIALDSQCGGADVDDGIACATAEALRVTERVARRLLDGTPTTDEHIAAAIRAARGENR